MSSRRASKPSAADRTVDLFSGKTKLEETHEAEPVETGDTQETREAADPTIEANVDRWRDKAFEVQEWSTRLFGHPENPGSQWRMTKKAIGGRQYYLLERVWSAGKSAASYASFMFLDEGDSLYGLADVVVKAARERKNAERE